MSDEARAPDAATGTPDVSPELPTPAWRAALALLQQLPQAGLSRAFGRIADMRIPVPMRRAVLGSFARAIGIDVSEAERTPEEYESLNAFFVRRLKPGVRTWPADPRAAGSPVDGTVGQLGTIVRGRLIQAKGRDYKAGALLGSDDEAARFEGGSFVTLYLSPRDYHRIHAPCDGTIALARHVPGALLPVNAAAVAHIDQLFPRNERVLCYIDGPLGRVAVVAIGAYNVGRISTAFDPQWGERGHVSNTGASGVATRTYDPPIAIARGAELMAFHLGSTVVVMFEPDVRLESSVTTGSAIRLGQPIGLPSAS